MTIAKDANTDLLDPLQGMDIKVQVIQSGSTAAGAGQGLLVGAFTSLMFKIVNQTEVYLPLNSRIPRALDGEIIIVWSLEQGLIDLDILSNTFGSGFASGMNSARGSLIPRSQRFSILFETNTSKDEVISSSSDQGYRQDSGQISATGNPVVQYALQYCRVDTCNFGVTAGRHIAANTWQGTAQQIGKPNTPKAP